MNFDAIIIGAGPAGSTVSLALARMGWSVAVVEKASFPRRKVCGEFMSATSLAVIDRLGIGDTLRRAAGPEIRRLALFAGDDVVKARMPAASDGGFGRALGRDVLDDLLVRAARGAGAQIFQPCQAVAVSAEDGVQRVRIAMRDRATMLRAPVLIAAHGSWEHGNLSTQLEKINNPSDFFGFKTHFRDASLAPDIMPLLAFPGGYGGIVWADSGRLSLSCCMRRDALARARKTYGNTSASEAVHRHLMASCRGVRDVVGNANLEGQWLAAGPIRPGIRQRYAADIFRVGNVAGESHPIIAEGISMAIQSGWLLALELSRVDARSLAGREAAGKRYSAAWRTQFATRIYAATAFAQIAIRPSSANFAHAAIKAAPAILTIGARLSGKTSLVGFCRVPS